MKQVCGSLENEKRENEIVFAVEIYPADVFEAYITVLMTYQFSLNVPIPPIPIGSPP